MADKKVKSIIPDVPLYGNPHTQAKTGVPDAGQPAKKGPAKPFSNGRKSAVKKPFADPETGKITDIDSLIEPPAKSEGLKHYFHIYRFTYLLKIIKGKTNIYQIISTSS